MSGILSAIITVFGIMFLGLLTERRRILAPTMALCLNQFVYWISLPALIFMQMCTIPMGEAQSFICGTLIASFFCYLAAYIVFSRLWKKHDQETVIHTLSSVFPNAAFFALPFIFMVFPNNEEAATAGMLGALLYTGVFLIADASLGMFSPGEKGKNLCKKLLRELMHNPMLIAAVLGAALECSGILVPNAIISIARMLGSTAAPCALFGMGMVLSAQLSGTYGGKVSLNYSHLAGISVAKLILQPLITCIALIICGCSATAVAVGTVTASMPTANMVFILGEHYRACPGEASLAIIVTTLLSVFSLPAVMFVLRCAGLV